MSKEQILINLGIDSEIAKENIEQYISNLKNANLELNFNYQLPEGTLERFKDYIKLINNLKIIISEGFPSINPDEFIKFLFTSPITSNKLDFTTLIKLYNLINDQSAYKVSHDDLYSEITVNGKTESINIEKYLKLFKEYVYPVISSVLISYCFSISSTEQMNRIERQNEIIIEQNEQVNYKLEIIEKLNEKEVELIEDKINRLMEQQTEYNKNQEKVIEILNRLSVE